MRIVKDVHAPAGMTRALLRAPIAAYRLGFGWMFGRRLLLLNHLGRVSGLPRQTVLEVVAYEPVIGSYLVASGWGPRAAWYRNVVAEPDVAIQVGRRVIPVTAEALSEDDGADVFVRYAARHRRTARFVLPRVLGMAVDGSTEDFRAVGRRMPFVRFVPRL